MRSGVPGPIRGFRAAESLENQVVWQQGEELVAGDVAGLHFKNVFQTHFRTLDGEEADVGAIAGGKVGSVCTHTERRLVPTI